MNVNNAKPQALSSCPDCGYDLRGLPPVDRDNPCPECAYPSKLYAPPSLLLRHADPVWLRRVCRGTSAQIWSFHCCWVAIVSALALMFSIIVTSVVLEFTVPRWIETLDPIFTYLFLLPFIVGTVGVLLHITGVWLSTAAPRNAEHLSTGSRRLCRWSGVVFAPMCCVATLPIPQSWSENLPWAVIFLSACGLAVAAMYCFAARDWCRRLDFYTEKWTAASPKRYRRALNNILGATAASLIVDTLFVVERVSGFRSPMHDESGFQTWPFWMMLGFAAVVQDALSPAHAGVLHEYRCIEARGSRTQPEPGGRPSPE